MKFGTLTRTRMASIVIRVHKDTIEVTLPMCECRTLFSSERTSAVPLGAAYLQRKSHRSPRKRLDVSAVGHQSFTRSRGGRWVPPSSDGQGRPAEAGYSENLQTSGTTQGPLVGDP